MRQSYGKVISLGQRFSIHTALNALLPKVFLYYFARLTSSRQGFPYLVTLGTDRTVALKNGLLQTDGV